MRKRWITGQALSFSGGRGLGTRLLPWLQTIQGVNDSDHDCVLRILYGPFVTRAVLTGNENARAIAADGKTKC